MGALFTGDEPDRQHGPTGRAGRSDVGARVPATSSPLDRQMTAFDAVAELYDDAYPHKAGQIIATQWLIDRLWGGARVLDLGCGTGEPTTWMLAEIEHQVVGVDLSARMLDRARRCAPAGRFMQRDMRGLDGSLGIFDAAAVFHSLSMLPRADIPGVLRWLQGALRPNAPVAIGMVEGDLDDSPQPLLDQQVRLTAYPLEDLVAMVTAAGLHVTEVDVEEYEPAGDILPERHLYLYCTTRGTPARPSTDAASRWAGHGSRPDRPRTPSREEG